MLAESATDIQLVTFHGGAAVTASQLIALFLFQYQHMSSFCYLPILPASHLPPILVKRLTRSYPRYTLSPSSSPWLALRARWLPRGQSLCRRFCKSTVHNRPSTHAPTSSKIKGDCWCIVEHRHLPCWTKCKRSVTLRGPHLSSLILAQGEPFQNIGEKVKKRLDGPC